MQIQIVRSTVAKPVDGPARAVDPGDIISVDDAQGRQLIGLGKARPYAEPLAPLQPSTPEDALAPVEVRTAGPKRRKGR